MRIRKTEAGQGGKLGHSRMTHWDYTEFVKKQAKKRRRINDKQLEKVDDGES